MSHIHICSWKVEVSVPLFPWYSKEVSEILGWPDTLLRPQGFVSRKYLALVSDREQGRLCGRTDLGNRACVWRHMLQLLVLRVFCAFVKMWNDTLKFNQSNYECFIRSQDRGNCVFCGYTLIICYLFAMLAADGYVGCCPRYSSKTASKMGPSCQSTSNILKMALRIFPFTFAYYIMCCTHNLTSRMGLNLFLSAANQSYLKTARVNAKLMLSSLLCLWQSTLLPLNFKTKIKKKTKQKPKTKNGEGKKEKTNRKWNVADIYCMTVQITAPGKINLPGTKTLNPLWNGGGVVWLRIPGLV